MRATSEVQYVKVESAMTAIVANRFGAEVTVRDALFVLPAVQLAAALPVSIGAWGGAGVGPDAAVGASI
jgi:hypothetical protein